MQFARLYPRREIVVEETAGESIASWLAGAFRSVKLILSLSTLLLTLGGCWYYYRGYAPPNAPTTLKPAEIEAKAVQMFNHMESFHVKDEEWDSMDDMKEMLFSSERRKLFPHKLTGKWEGEFKTKTLVEGEEIDLHAFGNFELLPDRTFNFKSTTHESYSSGNNEADTLDTAGRWVFMDGLVLLHGKQSILLSHHEGTLKIIGFGQYEKIKLFNAESPTKHTALSMINFE